MKKIYIFALVAMLFAACATDAIDEQSVKVEEQTPDTLVGTFEGDDSRIQLQNGKTVWTKGDEVSVFYLSNANQKWQYQGETGERTGNLKRANVGNATETMKRVVVVYPYNENYYINTDTYNVKAWLPATQTYLKDSYGLDGNIMISQSEYNQFSLRNVCGWLRIQLTGNGEKVQSITLRGNNSEQVAGEIYINSADATSTLASEMGGADDGENSAGGNLVFDDTILTEVVLNCGEGVTLSSEATAFYIALPPQTFEKGLTIEILATDGSAMTKSTDKEIIINRNAIQPMTELAYDSSGEATPVVSSKISTIEEQICNIEATIKTLETTKSAINTVIDSLNESGEVITRANDSNNGVKTMIAALENRVAELEQIINNLTAYTKDDLSRATDWAVATFATLDQYNALATELATIKAMIASMDGVSVESINTALAASEESMKLWVNEQLVGYYTIAEVDAQIAALKDNITAELQQDVEAVIETLSALKSEMEESYKHHIESAINDYAGVVNEQIATEIASINKHIDSELATINSRLDDIEARLDKIEEAITDLVNRIQSVSYIKKYGNEATPIKTSSTAATIELDFEVSPKSTVSDLSAKWDACVKVQALYSGTTTFVNLPIKSFSANANNGIISIVASGENLSDEFYSDLQSASLRLEISDGNNDRTSEYITIAPERWCNSDITNKPASNEIYYITSNNTAIEPYDRHVFGGSLEKNIYDWRKGAFVLKFTGDVTQIGAKAFYGKSSLKKIAIPDCMTTIGDSAFSGCSSLVDITTLDNVVSIGSSAFYGCTALNAASLGNDLQTIGESAFYGCKLLPNVTIGSSVTSIGKSAFYNCTSLTSVTIPESVTSIGEWTFSHCTSLTSVTIPDSVTSIGNYAFSGCTSLTRVDITDLSAWCKISFGHDIANPLSNGAKLYLNGIELTDITIPSDITEIKDYTFYGCTSLTSVTIPDSVTSIGSQAFCDCTSLKEVYCDAHTPPVISAEIIMDADGDEYLYGPFPTNVGMRIYVPSVTTYLSDSNWVCYKLYIVAYTISYTSTSKVVPYNNAAFGVAYIGNEWDAETGCGIFTFDGKITSIGNNAFRNCSNLTSITIPDSVTSIGKVAFYNCTSLTRVDITDLSAWCKISFGDSYATPLNNGAKLYLNGIELTDITIPSDITEIKAYAFCGCTSLTSVTIPNSVTSIGERAFYNCTSLISITIPDSVTSIGKSAFSGCTSLKEVYCKPTTPPTGGSYMFSYYNSGYKPIGCKIYVPTESVEAYKAAEYWSDYASDIEGYDF